MRYSQLIPNTERLPSDATTATVEYEKRNERS